MKRIPCIAAWLGGFVVLAAQAGPLGDEANAAFWWGDFDALEAVYRRAAASRERQPTGRLPLYDVRRGLFRVFNDHRTEAQVGQLEALTRQWAATHPDSILAQLLYARALYEHAWFIRGGGFANTVPKRAMDEFSRYIKMAEDVIAGRAGFLLQDTTAHLYLLMIERSRGASLETQWAVLQNGADRNPDDMALYEDYVTSTLPKWGGNARQLERVAREAQRRAASGFGLAAYAEVYTVAAYEFRGGLFRETEASWPDIRQGFRELIASYPHPDNVNAFGFVACLSEDKTTAREVLDRLGDHPDLYWWGGGRSNSTVLDTCRRWVREP